MGALIKSYRHLVDPTTGMGEMHLPTSCWIMVAMIAAFTVWTCLSVLGSAAAYERRRRTLGREVKDLRQRYSLSLPGLIIRPDTGTESDRKAA